MEKLSRFLAASLKQAGLEGRVQEGKLFGKWAEIVGPRVAAQTRPRAIRKGVLVVETTSAAWSNELTMLKPQFLAAIKRTLGPGVVREIKFQITSWREEALSPGYQAPEKKSLPRAELTPAERAGLEGEVSGIEDPKLKQKIGHFLEVLKRRQKAQAAAGYRLCACGSLYEGPEERCPICRLSQ